MNNKYFVELNGYLVKDKEARDSIETTNKEIEKVENYKNLVCNIAYRDCSEFINGITDETNPIEGYIQGITTTNNTIIIAMQTGGSYDRKSNMVYLKEISKETGETIRSAFLELFHANSLAYNESKGEIYVATNSYIDENFVSQPMNDIIIVDYDTFTIKEIITPPSEITNNNHVRSVSYDNKNGVLALADVTDVWIMSDWGTVEKHIVLDMNYTAPITNPIQNHTTNQNTVVYDNKIYSTRYGETGVVVYDIDGNIIQNYYSFDIDIPTQIGELESIAIEEDGNIYLATAQLIKSTNDVCMLYDITIYKSNLKYNGFKNYFYSYDLSNRVAFYVDCETTNHLQAGTVDKPFKSIQQAIDSAQFIKKNVSCTINLVGTNKQYGFISTKNNISLIINGNNNLIYAMEIFNQNIEINNLTVNNDVLVNVVNENNPSNIRITNQSNVLLNNVSIVNNDTKLNYAIYLGYSNLRCYQLTVNNFVNVFKLINHSTLKTSNMTVTNCDYYWYNEANCEIYDNNIDVIEKQNPSSQVLSNYKSYQKLPFTFSNGSLTLNNIGYDENRMFIFDVRLTLDDSSVHVKAMLVRGGYNNVDGFNIIKSGNLYNIHIEALRSSQGNWTINIHVTKTVISTGVVSDVTSNTSFNLRGVLAL